MSTIAPSVDTRSACPALGRTNDWLIASAQRRVVEAALAFVRRGLLDSLGTRRAAELDAFVCKVRCHFMECISMTQVPQPPRGHTLGQAHRLALHKAIRAFHEGFRDAVKLVLPGVLPPQLFSEELEVEQTSALQVFGKPLPEAPSSAAPPLVQAFAMSSFNRLRAEQRIGVLLLLGAVTGSDSSLSNEIASQGELDTALKHLWKQRGVFTMQTLAMGVLAGGEHLQQARALAKDLYNPGISVIELLELDGMVPARYESAREDALRQALDSA